MSNVRPDTTLIADYIQPTHVRPKTAAHVPADRVGARSSGCAVAAAVRRACADECLFASILRPLSFQAEIDDVFLPARYAGPVALAVRELLCNACVHAYPPGQPAQVGVHLWRVRRTEDVRAILLVADAGCGLGNAPFRGGLARAYAAVETVCGQLDREPGPGTVWRMTLRYPSRQEEPG